MKKILLLSILILVTAFVQAQSILQSRRTSFFTYIFQLNEEEAKKIYQKDLYVVDHTYFHSAIDSFVTDKAYEKVLPHGHYLITYADGGDLVYELKSVNNLTLQLLNNKVDLSMLVTDSTGKIIEDAAVFINKLPVSFNKKSGTYLLKKSSRKGLVTISYQGITSYHSIAKQNKQPFVRRIKNRIIYSRPIYWLWKPVKDVVSSIRHKYPEGWIRKMAGVINPDEFSNTEKKYRGYMAFNKPMYLPGDTVKFKAFISRRGKPIGYDLKVVLNTMQGRKILTTLQPYRKGGYSYEFVLHDSLQLQLDRNYGIALESKKYRTLLYGSFNLEAYELQSHTFAIRSNQTTHHTGTSVRIFAQGKDENELNVANATLQLTVIPEQVLHFTSQQVFVKDTLWQHQLKLDPVGETTIVLPDSIFPALDLDYTIHAVFLNASNERHQKTHKLRHIHRQQEIKLTLDKDTLLASYLVTGKTSQAKAQLTSWTHGQEKPVVSSLELPSKISLNPYVYRYDFKVDTITTSILIEEEEPLLQCYAHRTADSLLAWVENPRNLTFFYTIYVKNQAIERGSGKTLNFKAKVKTPANCFISLQYIWTGKVQEKEFAVPFQKNKLKIHVNQPVVVSPGQIADVDILVTDTDGLPAQQVDVTAYAITGKFKNVSVPEVPYLGKTYKNRKSLHEFNLDQKFSTDQDISRPLNYHFWNSEMGLDSIAYYQFLYPENALFMQYVSTSDSLALFAPFVVKDGKLQSVYIIYLDSRPVYYKDADVTQRYAFQARSGYHSIKLRTTDHEITVDSVWLKPYSKLVLSIDVDAFHKHVKIQPAKREYSQHEQQLLNRYVMHIQHNFGGKDAYLKQGNFIQPLVTERANKYSYNSSNTIITGIYTPTPMEFVLRDGFTTSFSFEPFYIYQFQEQLLKMRSINPQNFYQYTLNPYYKEITPDFSEKPYRQQEMDSLWVWHKEAEMEKTNKYSYAHTTTYGYGKLVIHQLNLPDNAQKRIKALLLFKKNDPNFLQVFPAYTRTFHQLKPGEYQVVILLYFNYFIETDYLSVAANGSNYIAIENIPIQLPNEFSRNTDTMIRKAAYTLQEEMKDLQEIKENFYNTYNITPTGSFTHLVTGQVTDVEGVVLPGVNVVVKGTASGTVTDRNGRYFLYAPLNGVLVFSFIGYAATEKLIGSQALVDAQLMADIKALSEVVVVGYGVQRKASIIASVSTATALQGKVAGVQLSGDIQVRGAANSNTGKLQLIILNGVPFSGTLADIDPTVITSKQLLKGDIAKTLYGALAENGAILITTTESSTFGKTLSLPTLAQTADHTPKAQSLRSNFSDYAYWQPRLTTNKDGKASFKVTFPDDVTSWRTFILAMDNYKRSGVAEGKITAFKPVVSTLSVPRFLIAGDTSWVIGKTSNYTADTLTLSTAFITNENTQNEHNSQVLYSLIDSLQITATVQDSIKISYVNKNGGDEDGELRYIPVLPRGTQLSKGVFLNLDTDTTLHLNFNPELGKVKVLVQGNMLQVLLHEIEQIKRYEYFCNEQAASKLIALLLEKKIRNTLGETFSHEKEIQKLLNKLQSDQRKDGTWGWWPDSSPILWISLHVAEAFNMAEKAGYRVNYNKQVLQDYLIFELENYRARDQLKCLQILKTLQAKVDYQRYMAMLAKDTSMHLLEQLQLIELRHQTGIAFSLDTLNSHKQRTMTGGMYVGEERPKNDYHFTDNTILTTVAAYRILKATGGYQADLQAMRRYFMEIKSNGNWRNTYESALILSAILPDLLSEGKLPASTLLLKGALQHTISNFPFETVFTPGQPLVIHKADKQPVYFTAYQQYWTTVPDTNNKHFIVQSYFTDKHTNQAQLKAGKPVKLTVEVEAKQDADYLMLEVPVPAGCSFEEKHTNYTYEAHREFFKHQTSIFCQRLKKGKYTFTISVLPRYKGTYTLNPAKVQLMYFPVYYGLNEIKQVKVE